MGLYAMDGKCHNAEPGTYGHECGKSAPWIGTTKSGFEAGFCDDCKRHGYEAKAIVVWRRRHSFTAGAFLTGYRHAQTQSWRAAEERFPLWSHDQIEAYLNGNDDAVAGDRMRYDMILKERAAQTATVKDFAP